jgi:predicted kinase
MLGFPGSGKTTVSKIIHEQTGAVHLWADHERRKRFGKPTHSHPENLKLYAELNHVADTLLGEGKSVIFDTNFNFYKDREHLRSIAAKHGAKTVVIWMRTPKELARERATKDAHMQHTRVLGDMPVEHFERIAGNLQPPREGEHVVEFDGSNLTRNTVIEAIKDL